MCIVFGICCIIQLSQYYCESMVESLRFVCLRFIKIHYRSLYITNIYWSYMESDRKTYGLPCRHISLYSDYKQYSLSNHQSTYCHTKYYRRYDNCLTRRKYSFACSDNSRKDYVVNIVFTVLYISFLL
jgi:hypothetical protein